MISAAYTKPSGFEAAHEAYLDASATDADIALMRGYYQRVYDHATTTGVDGFVRVVEFQLEQLDIYRGIQNQLASLRC